MNASKSLRSLSLILVLSILLLPLSAAQAAPGDTTRVSVASDGTQGNGESSGLSISADGRYVLFSSDSRSMPAFNSHRQGGLFLRDAERTRFDLLMCLSGMDYTGGKLGVVYHLNSTSLHHSITLKVQVTADAPHVESVAQVWKTANWHEREAFDMFGIVFDNHPDLRRILLPDDWEGHPLRKDYQVPEYYNGMKVPY